MTISDWAAWDLHDWSEYHREVVESSQLVGCFYCLRSYCPSYIKEWSDDGQTAICGFCGIDAVIPGELLYAHEIPNWRVLHHLKAYWFDMLMGEDESLVDPRKPTR